MSRDINITGGDELFAALQELPLKLEINVMRGAVRAGAKILLEDAKARVPVKTGTLKDTIRISTGAKNGKIYAFVKAGSRVNNGGQKGKTGADRGAFYAHMIEYGTAPHTILPKNGGSLLFGGKFVKVIHHPGSAPHPFMRPSFYGKADAATQRISEYIGARLDKLNDKSE